MNINYYFNYYKLYKLNKKEKAEIVKQLYSQYI